MNSSRDEDEDDEAFAPWPFKQRNKPPATTSRSASAAKPKKADDFKALDEEELLADLFGAADDNRSQKLRKKRADEAEAPARKLRKTRSRERGVVHPKLNPLKITGGNAKAKPPSPVALDERGVEEEEKEEENALEDSVEDVEGEECPLCEQRFSADLLQAHVEAELEQRNPSAAGGQQAPRPQPPSRSGAGPGVEVVVLDDEEEEEIECSGDGGGPEGDKAECPFCQRHFRRGVELEEHVHHEMTLRENGGSGGASGEQARRGGAGECEGRRTVTRTRLPLVRQSSRKLPSSFGANDAPADGTLNSFFAKRAPASASSSSSSSSSGSVALVPDSQPARSQKRPATEGGEEGAEDEDNYDDVTFNFKCVLACPLAHNQRAQRLILLAVSCVVCRVRVCATGRCGRPRSCRTTTRISSTSRRRNEEEEPKSQRTKKRKRSNPWRSTWWRRSKRLRPPSEGEEAEAGEGEARDASQVERRRSRRQAAPSIRRRAGVEHEEADGGEVEPGGVVETNSHRRTTSFSNTRYLFVLLKPRALSSRVFFSVHALMLASISRSRSSSSCTGAVRCPARGGQVGEWRVRG
jgi:hypothetical protein